MVARFTLPGDERVALSIVVNVEEGAEQSIAAGDKHPEPVDELGVALRIPIRNLANEKQLPVRHPRRCRAGDAGPGGA